ncbi:FMN-binding glutamate synthase family protein [Roseibium aggregatum]|uniref:FMN-binding glutamate synthase family protein n=1 Tax=Roseibium aggregatum TaxID=187304 RepID=UPI001A8F6A0C|nr:FMN-binding glutamate synthase family protein [Roseibium aggregatum]MBN8180236.1 FMN-binding glutamate synthase family protein [Roseibium aggregatum]UES36559.1 FMN-binding glutamate synthase family protein [Roseibium aggregatum]UES45621.1 FMN-binding glutamate synthase family protein [Roseibium aggregatum]
MFPARYTVFILCIVLALVALVLTFALSGYFVWPFLVFAVLSAIGYLDIRQTRHAILRNYPVSGHFRFLFEAIRPELRQYFFESNQDGRPFSRERRSMVYDRAKDIEDVLPFGTELDVYDTSYGWVNHSICPKPHNHEDMRVTIGGPDCKQPYSASLYNISAMSFGSLSGNAILALNKGAKAGGFYHDTGEGSVSRYHRQGGGDLVWELGSGYFGCRADDGTFDAEKFAKQAVEPQIKMIEIKMSQGAKPGHGGVLPGPKVTEEIAEARGVPIGTDCISPASHSAFSTPVELLHFIAQLRELSGGKPVGFKLCIGHRWEFMAIVKAMLKTGIKPDFIVVDGAEGGTGAAPVEFANRLGTPLRQGLTFVHNCLVGTGLREDIRIGAAGKLISAFDIAGALALGADWVNSARGFMFAVGCIQSQSCHTNRCPTGVATQDPKRQQALVVPDKAQRVANFHRNTLKSLRDFSAAAGLSHPREFKPEHFYLHEGLREIMPASVALSWLKKGALLEKSHNIPGYSTYWEMAEAESFHPAKSVEAAKSAHA